LSAIAVLDLAQLFSTANNNQSMNKKAGILILLLSTAAKGMNIEE